MMATERRLAEEQASVEVWVRKRKEEQRARNMARKLREKDEKKKIADEKKKMEEFEKQWKKRLKERAKEKDQKRKTGEKRKRKAVNFLGRIQGRTEKTTTLEMPGEEEWTAQRRKEEFEAQVRKEVKTIIRTAEKSAGVDRKEDGSLKNVLRLFRRSLILKE